MTNEDYLAIRDKAVALRRDITAADNKHPASIGYLESVLKSLSTEDQTLIYELLIRECALSGDSALALHFSRQQCAEQPNDSMARCALAWKLALTFPTSPASSDEAVAHLRLALQTAKAQNRLVRYCCNEMARVALHLKNRTLLKEALSESIADAPNTREEDVGLAADIVEQLPILQLDETLIEQYKRAVASRSKI